MWMWPFALTRWHLLRRLDTTRIEDAIKRAESGTSGEIRISVAGFFRGDIRRLAEQAFHRLGMDATSRRNGVLIVVAPARREFVILGDQGFHLVAGDAFWSHLAQKLSARFRNQEFTAGLIEAIDAIGAGLADCFPPDPNGRDINELPNAVDVTRNDRA